MHHRTKACVKGLAEFEISRDMDTVICLNSGGIILRECVITMKSLINKLKQKFCSVVTFPQTSLNLIGCDFIGNETDHCTAAITINSNV